MRDSIKNNIISKACNITSLSEWCIIYSQNILSTLDIFNDFLYRQPICYKNPREYDEVHKLLDILSNKEVNTYLDFHNKFKNNTLKIKELSNNLPSNHNKVIELAQNKSQIPYYVLPIVGIAPPPCTTFTPKPNTTY